MKKSMVRNHECPKITIPKLEVEKETPIVHQNNIRTYKQYTNNPLSQESSCEKSLAKRGFEPREKMCLCFVP